MAAAAGVGRLARTTPAVRPPRPHPSRRSGSRVGVCRPAGVARGAGAASRRRAPATPARRSSPRRDRRGPRLGRRPPVRPAGVRLRLTRRARRLAVVLALAAGVALGSWLGPLLSPVAEATCGSPGCESVVVQPGDTLWSIATSLDGDGDVRAVVDEIQELNGLNGAAWFPARPCCCRDRRRVHAVRAGPARRAPCPRGSQGTTAGPPAAERATAEGPQRRRPTSSTLSAGAFTLCGRSSAYGRRVSGAMENRAAVFTSQPQAVEVYQAGAWWAGELLGWRHDANGSCQVWVRVVLGGVEETAWTDLTTLRLPERHLAVAAQPAAALRPGDAGDVRRPAPVGPSRPLGGRRPGDGRPAARP